MWGGGPPRTRSSGEPDAGTCSSPAISGCASRSTRYGAVPRSAPEEAARAWAGARYPEWGSYATLYLWRKLVADRFGRETG